MLTTAPRQKGGEGAESCPHRPGPLCSQEAGFKDGIFTPQAVQGVKPLLEGLKPNR